MASFKQREQSFRQNPTRVFLQATVIQSGGDIRHDAVKRIRAAMLEAFTDAAAAEGLESTWMLDMKTKTPKDFDTFLAHRRLFLREPTPVPDAVGEASE